MPVVIPLPNASSPMPRANVGERELQLDFDARDFDRSAVATRVDLVLTTLLARDMHSDRALELASLIDGLERAVSGSFVNQAAPSPHAPRELLSGAGALVDQVEGLLRGLVPFHSTARSIATSEAEVSSSLGKNPRQSYADRHLDGIKLISKDLLGHTAKPTPRAKARFARQRMPTATTSSTASSTPSANAHASNSVIATSSTGSTETVAAPTETPVANPPFRDFKAMVERVKAMAGGINAMHMPSPSSSVAMEASPTLAAKTSR
jgi:hypothetical protein